MTGLVFLVGLIAILIYILLLILASIYAGIILGSWLWKSIKKEYQVDWPAVLLGVIIVSLVKLIPILGGIFIFFL